MGAEVFVDTSAWIAVSDLCDRHHPAARVAYNRLIADRRMLVTTNLVIAETYIITRRAAGHLQAMRLLRSLRGSTRLVRVYSDSVLEAAAEVILERHDDQDFSFTDEVSFAVMQHRGIQEAFTFDSHFAAMGFSLLPVEGRGSVK
jgi:predicted nucleic acid-binding protein